MIIKVIESLKENNYSVFVNGKFKGFFYGKEVIDFIESLNDYTLDLKLNKNDKLYKALSNN